MMLINEENILVLKKEEDNNNLIVFNSKNFKFSKITLEQNHFNYATIPKKTQ